MNNADFLTFGQISRHPEIVGRWSNHHSTHLNEADLMNHAMSFHDHSIVNEPSLKVNRTEPNRTEPVVNRLGSVRTMIIPSRYHIYYHERNKSNSGALFLYQFRV